MSSQDKRKGGKDEPVNASTDHGNKNRIETEIRKIVKWFGQKLCTVKKLWWNKKNIGIIWVFYLN